MSLGEPIRVATMVAGQFEKEGIPYAVVGSVVSSVYGIPRSTQDVDMVAAMKDEDVESFVAGLKEDFYVDTGMIREAIEHQSSFNVIHFDTVLKVDVFVVSEEGLTGDELQRAQSYAFGEGEDAELRIASPEDVIVRKLKWYRSGGEVSDQQWKDIQGMLQIQKDHLDWGYMEEMASRLGVRDLLTQAMKEGREG